ncbi:hypothetical protein FPZ24_04765 [Sphingomonas panacisoli]|uniref:Uncharacterized protein n=1 Tax=Sphingomonas panacisoli TaxID=1813879 RepID=A0A5B8LGH3_9SPHN|nr:hypothetical protein [Sphingomonas panacisoli]QDZ06875.1 hypothetical protein FPZ24_04765 [Sphingomonas panacisoli]
MTSWPCFPSAIRRTAPLAGYDWARTGAVILLAVCAVLAAIAGATAWRHFRRVRDEASGGHDALAEIGHGRTRFVALWGAYLGAGFALATLVTLAGFLLVPQCLG